MITTVVINGEERPAAIFIPQQRPATKRCQIAAFISPHMDARINAELAALDISRSELMRRALAAYLEPQA